MSTPKNFFKKQKKPSDFRFSVPRVPSPTISSVLAVIIFERVVRGGHSVVAWVSWQGIK
jgi:hypothetical protein